MQDPFLFGDFRDCLGDWEAQLKKLLMEEPEKAVQHVEGAFSNLRHQIGRLEAHVLASLNGKTHECWF